MARALSEKQVVYAAHMRILIDQVTNKEHYKQACGTIAIEIAEPIRNNK